MRPLISDDMSIAAIVAMRPDAETRLAALGIDNCCGAHATLAEHCERLRLDTAQIIRQLEAPPGPLHAFGTPPRHIHSRLRELLPRTIELSRRVAAAHGAHRPELIELEQVIDAIVRATAIRKDTVEQRVLPTLDGPTPAGTSPDLAPIAPIADRQTDDREINVLFSRARDLTGGFVTPRDACNSWQMLMQALHELETVVLAWIQTEAIELTPAAQGLGSSQAAVPAA